MQFGKSINLTDETYYQICHFFQKGLSSQQVPVYVSYGYYVCKQFEHG